MKRTNGHGRWEHLLLEVRSQGIVPTSALWVNAATAFVCKDEQARLSLENFLHACKKKNSLSLAKCSTSSSGAQLDAMEWEREQNKKTQGIQDHMSACPEQLLYSTEGAGVSESERLQNLQQQRLVAAFFLEAATFAPHSPTFGPGRQHWHCAYRYEMHREGSRRRTTSSGRLEKEG